MDKDSIIQHVYNKRKNDSTVTVRNLRPAKLASALMRALWELVMANWRLIWGVPVLVVLLQPTLLVFPRIPTKTSKIDIIENFKKK